jgi:hypothetical protein
MAWWPVLIFGWGAVVVAATAFFLALCLNRPWLVFVGAAIATPFCLFISGYPHPIGRLGGPIVLLANFASAALLRKGEHRRAMLLLVPFAIVALVLAYLVITQEPPVFARSVVTPAVQAAGASRALPASVRGPSPSRSSRRFT